MFSNHSICQIVLCRAAMLKYILILKINDNINLSFRTLIDIFGFNFVNENLFETINNLSLLKRWVSYLRHLYGSFKVNKAISDGLENRKIINRFVLNITVNYLECVHYCSVYSQRLRFEPILHAKKITL